MTTWTPVCAKRIERYRNGSTEKARAEYQGWLWDLLQELDLIPQHATEPGQEFDFNS